MRAMLKIDIAQVETAAKELYVRALKQLPPDIKAGFARLSATETDSTATTRARHDAVEHRGRGAHR